MSRNPYEHIEVQPDHYKAFFLELLEALIAQDLGGKIDPKKKYTPDPWNAVSKRNKKIASVFYFKPDEVKHFDPEYFWRRWYKAKHNKAQPIYAESFTKALKYIGYKLPDPDAKISPYTETEELYEVFKKGPRIYEYPDYVPTRKKNTRKSVDAENNDKLSPFAISSVSLDELIEKQGNNRKTEKRPPIILISEYIQGTRLDREYMKLEINEQDEVKGEIFVNYQGEDDKYAHKDHPELLSKLEVCGYISHDSVLMLAWINSDRENRHGGVFLINYKSGKKIYGSYLVAYDDIPSKRKEGVSDPKELGCIEYKKCPSEEEALNFVLFKDEASKGKKLEFRMEKLYG